MGEWPVRTNGSGSGDEEAGDSEHELPVKAARDLLKWETFIEQARCRKKVAVAVVEIPWMFGNVSTKFEV